MQQCNRVNCLAPAEPHEDFCWYCLHELEAAYAYFFAGHSGEEGGSAPCCDNQAPTDGPIASDFLEMAHLHMIDRAQTYDAPSGERSMAKTVAAFNAITGKSLTETEGWTFMELLKIARSFQGGFKQDNFEDRVAYAALAGEAASREAE